MVRRDALQAAYCDWFVFDPTAATSRFAGTVAHTTQNSGKDIRLAIEHIGVGKPTLGDQANIVGNVRVGRARPLTVNDFMKVVWLRGICWLHSQGCQVGSLIDALAVAAVASPFCR